MSRTSITRPYSKVVRDMWGDERFLKLSAPKPNARDLWIYLLTGPHVTIIPGLLPRMSLTTLAEDLKWPSSSTKHLWDEITAQCMAEADWAAQVIWLPNGFRHNVPANPNIVTGWRSVTLPQCDLVSRALAKLRLDLWRLDDERAIAAKARGKDLADVKGWVEAFDEVFGKRFPESIIAGFPEPLGESETRSGSGTEDHPQTPSMTRGPKVSLRRPSPKELDDAKKLRRAEGGCNHTPPCGDFNVCVGRIVYVQRHNQMVGMLTEADA